MSVHAVRNRLAVSLAVLGLAACGSSSGPAAAPQSTGTTSDAITIINYAFGPATLTVAPGATVTVRNADQYAHHPASTKSGVFDTGEIAGGSSKTFAAPTAPGTYTYLCTIHSSMHGTLIVKG